MVTNYKQISYKGLLAALVVIGGILFLGTAAHLASAADEQKVTIVDATNFRDYMSAYGDASIAEDSDLITVSPREANKQGAVYFNERIDVSQPFSVKLSVDIISGTTPADGMALGFTESPIGTHEAHSGLYVIENTVALIFDTYRNTPTGQTAEPAVPNATVRYTREGGSPNGFYDKDGNFLGELTVPGTQTALNATTFFAPFDLTMNYNPDTGMITYDFLGHTLETPLGDMGTDNGLAFIVSASSGQNYSDHRIAIQEIQATLLTPDPESITVEQDPTSGDVSITPLEAGGEPYPAETVINIDGVPYALNGNGTATIPKDQLAEYDAVKTVTVEESDKNPSNETTIVVPGYRTSPPSDIDTTKNDDGSRTIIPLKEDGSRYPEGTVVDVPGVGDVELDENGEGTIPAGQVPDYDETKSITVTEPGKDVSPNVEYVLPGSTTTAPDSPTATKDEDGNGVIHPTKPDGSSYPEGTIVEIVDVGEYPVDENGNITIPAEDMPTYDTDTSIIIHEDGKEPSEGVPITIPGNTTIDPGDVSVTRNEDGSATIFPTKPGGGTYPEGTVVDIPGIGEVTLDQNGAGTIPADDIPQYDTNAPATIKEADKAPSGEFTVPIEGYQTTSPSTDSISVEKNQDGSATVSATKPDGSPYPAGTVVTIPDVGEITLDENGQGTIPADQVPTYDTTAQATVKETDKDTSDPVSVFVPGSKTDEPGVVTVDKNPDGSGTVTVTKSGGGTYPAGTVVNLDGVGEVVLDENGNGVIPADQMPTYDGNVNATVEEDGKDPSDSVNVPVEGSKTVAPTQILSEKNSDGTGTITPLKADGSPYAAGTIVTLEGIGAVTLDENGQGTIQAGQMPEYDTPYSAVIEEAGKDSSDSADVVLVGRTTTPPDEVVTEKNPDGSITISPNKPDGTKYPEGTIVHIPDIGDIVLDENGNGVIPADKAPLYDTDATATITEPDKGTSELDISIPGSKTAIPGPITTRQNPDGSVTLTVKKADGTNYPAGTIVSIPGIGDFTLDGNGEGIIPANLVPQYDTNYSDVVVVEADKDPSVSTELFLAGSGIAPSVPNTGFGPILSSYPLVGLLASIIGVIVGTVLTARRKLKTS